MGYLHQTQGSESFAERETGRLQEPERMEDTNETMSHDTRLMRIWTPRATAAACTGPAQVQAGWGLSAETGTRTRPPISSLDAISNWYRLQGKTSFLQQSFIQAGPMPSRQWSIQNVLDDIFVDILSHVALFGHFLSYRSFTWILWFLILWGCWEVGVVYVSLFLLLFLCYFLILICLPFFQRKRKRRCGIGWWRSCENWEELVNGKSWSECIVWKIFPINKKKRSVIGKPVGHFLN